MDVEQSVAATGEEAAHVATGAASSRRGGESDGSTEARSSVDSRSVIRTRFLQVDTSNVADVLDDLGFPDQGLAPEFRPFPAETGRLAGWANTVRGQMTPYDVAGGDVDKMKACGELDPLSVSVWSGGGEGICFFGELIAIGMRERGCVGALVDGGVRDVDWLIHHEFPVYARYRTPVQSIGRWKVTGWNVPVFMPGATVQRVIVRPDDFILADHDGAIVIPAAVIGKVLEMSESIGKREEQIRQELAAGMSLRQALDRFGHV